VSLQSEILDSLDTPGWDESISAVKRVVRNALRQLDRTAEIEDTTYFNHSFVPDFVLTWPREPARTRDVFLRLDSSRAFLAGDLMYLGKSKPLLLGLTGLEQESAGDSDGTLKADVGESAAMLTEPVAVENLGSSDPSTDFAQVLPAAVLKGGRGLVTADVAVSLAETARDFFLGARTHQAAAISSAAPALAEHLDSAQTDRLLNFGRVVWEATGGETSSFPLTTELSGVDDAGLRFLLEEAPSDDLDFWRSVGRLVSLERLLSLGVREANNLAAFVRANADRLNARTLMIKSSQPRLDDGGPRWSVNGGALALTGLDFVAYMAAKRDDLTVRPDEGRGLDFETFRRRTSAEQVETVTIVASDGKRITVESDGIFDPATDAVLASVGGLPGVTVEAVGLTVTGRHLECEFASRVASGHTNAQFDVMSMLERALPVLWPLTDRRDLEELRELRRTVGSVAFPPSLFDDLPSSQDH
jgi:hypothetical protein